jgi:hypothetical protein
MKLTKNTYKENLKSVMLPTLELIIDEVVENSNEELYNRDKIHSNAHFFQLIARERIGFMLMYSKEVKESLKEYVEEIQKYKSPPINTENQKEFYLDTDEYKRISKDR